MVGHVFRGEPGSQSALPMVLAHRGLVTRYQENTMSAVKGAMESDFCDGCEVDVFLTRDERVVLFHDENLKRVTGVDKSIYDMEWVDLKQLTVRREIEVDGGMRIYEKEERIPLLSDVLEEIRGKDVFMDIEMKTPLPDWSKRKTGTEVAKLIRKQAVENQVIVSSFNFFMLYCLEKEFPQLGSGFAYDDNMPLGNRILNWVMERNLVGRFVHSDLAVVEHTLIDEDTIEKYHAKKMRVGTYTLFPLTPEGRESERESVYEAEVSRLKRLAVDWIETDDPQKVFKLIHQDERVA